MESSDVYFYTFLVGFAVLGVGSPSLWTLVPTHIDDITDHRLDFELRPLPSPNFTLQKESNQLCC